MHVLSRPRPDATTLTTTFPGIPPGLAEELAGRFDHVVDQPCFVWFYIEGTNLRSMSVAVKTAHYGTIDFEEPGVAFCLYDLLDRENGSARFPSLSVRPDPAWPEARLERGGWMRRWWRSLKLGRIFGSATPPPVPQDMLVRYAAVPLVDEKVRIRAKKFRDLRMS